MDVPAGDRRRLAMSVGARATTAWIVVGRDTIGGRITLRAEPQLNRKF
jgi:hypothetical protein